MADKLWTTAWTELAGDAMVDADKISDTSSTNKFATAAQLSAVDGLASTYQPLDSDLTTIAAANNGSVLAATTASFTTADETKLDGIAAGATTDATVDAHIADTSDAHDASAISVLDTATQYTATDVEAALAEVKVIADAAVTPAEAAAAYQPLDADLTTIAAANNGSVLAATTASFLTADETKLDGIEALADVTDTTNVTAAGALMDSEVASLSGIKTLTVPDSTTISTFGATLVDDADAATARTTLGVVIGTNVQAYDADTLKADTADTLTAGFDSSDYAAGTKSTGTYTPAASDGNFQVATNGGAHTLAPPSTSCSIVVHYTNNGSAGTITTSGFTAVTGDSFTTTDTHEFVCVITKVNDVSVLNVTALQ